MGIRLDWQVDSSEGTTPVEEDAAAAAARQRSERLTRRALIIGALIVVVGVSIAVWRLKRVEAQRRDYLEATIAAETLALRIGDEDEFLRAQSPSDAWLRHQIQSFRAYSSIPDMHISDEPVSIVISGDEAQVTLPVILDGQPDQAVWVYHYTDQGWLHIATNSEPWGEILRSTPGFDFYYYFGDEALVDTLNSLLNGWREQFCTLDNLCFSPVTVRIEQNSDQEIGWADAAATTLIVPGWVDPYDAPSFETLASLLAERWASEALRAEIASYEAWVRDDLALWLHSKMVLSRTQSTIFWPLEAAYGREFIPQFLTRLNDDTLASESIGQAATARSKAAPPITEREQMRQFLTYSLRAEAALRAWEDTNNANPNDGQWQSSIAFLDQDRGFSRERTMFFFVQPSVFAQAVPETINVMEITFMQGRVWAHVTYLTRTEPDPIPAQSWIMFKPSGTRWTHSIRNEVGWGQLTDLPISGENPAASLTIQYYEVDAEAVTGQAQMWLALYSEIAGDLGVTNGPPNATVRVMPVMEASDAGYHPNTITATVPSPHMVCCLGEQTPQGYLLEAGITSLIREMLAYRLGATLPPAYQHPILEGLIRWEYTHRTGLVLPHSLSRYGEYEPAYTLDALWVKSLGVNSGADPLQANADAAAAEVLWYVIVAYHGTGAIPVLLNELLTADSVYDWLESASEIGIDAALIEEAWQIEFDFALNNAAGIGLIPDDVPIEGQK